MSNLWSWRYRQLQENAAIGVDNHRTEVLNKALIETKTKSINENIAKQKTQLQ